MGIQMHEQALPQNGPGFRRSVSTEPKHELAVGTELMIAFAFGAIGWYAIARLIVWIAS